MKQNNWYVITGAPNSGKTTVLQLLEKKGYKVIYEAARIFIDRQLEKGLSIQKIRKDEQKFQDEVLQLKIDTEQSLDPKEIIFFDRGMHDTIAYYELIAMPINEKIKRAVKNSFYKKIFLFEQLPYKTDYARTENEEQAKQLELLLKKAYQSFPLVTVPRLTITKRLELIMKDM
jgi:predicted ATPase